MSLKAALLLAWIAVGQTGSAPFPAATGEEIARAVRNLGHPKYTVREEASRTLSEAGRAAEPALLEALNSDDPEVVARARRILRRFMLGIYPDTPPTVVNLIGQFYHGDTDAKHAALDRLMGMAEVETVLKLLDFEPSDTVREALTKNLVKELDTVGGGLFLAGDWARAEQLLRLGAVDDRGMRNYAAYLLLRGEIDEKIAAIKKPDGAKSEVDRRLLVYLWRAKGNLAAALTVAEPLDDAELTESLLLEAGDWKRLAEIYDARTRQPDGTLSGDIVELGFAAAYHRLAGNDQGFDEAVAAIHRLAEAKPNKMRDCAEALLINQRYEEALELYRRHGGHLQFDLLCRQGRYGDALREIGIKDPTGTVLPWLDEEADEDGPFGPASKRFSLGLRVAPILAKVDRDEDARQLLDELAEAARQRGEMSISGVCSAAMKMGLTDDAFRHAAAALDQQANTSLLRVLFPEHSEAAVIWWTYLKQARPHRPAAEVLEHVRTLLLPEMEPSRGGSAWRADVAAAELAANALDGRKRRPWLIVLADTCLIHGDRELARRYLEKAVESAPSATLCLRLGDLRSEDSAHREAALWYRKAWDVDPKQPLGLYLAGRALTAAGDADEGRRLVEVAGLAPLGNEGLRYKLAKGLADRELEDEAAAQWRIVLATGKLGSWSVNEAGKRMGNRLSPTDPLAAAEYWRRLLLGCLRTSTAIVDVGGYLQVTYVVHKARARGLLADGRIDRAVREMALAHQAGPGESRLAIDLVPKLDDLGHTEQGDALFEKVYAVEEQVVRDFPESPRARNNLAWLAARCNRRLDEALQHAEKANALAPDKPAYVDTLAEVHYRRGNKEKAVEFAQRCIELDGDREYYRRQLERFEAGEP